MRKPPVSTKPRSRTQVNGSVSPLGNKGVSPAAGRNARPKPQADDVPHLDDEDADDDEGHSEFESAEIEGDAAIDDPVRMYLMQMGEIPMLNRDNEVAAAVQIESTRRRFRRTMLCSDYMLHAAVDLLQKVADGTLRLDRTIEISVTNTTEKKRILKRIAPNLATARELLGLNQKDYRRAVSRRTTVAEKHLYWRRMIARRNKVIRLVEELNLRIQRLTPLMSQLHEISERMWSLKSQLAQAEQSFHHANEHELRHELRYLMRITQETPATQDRKRPRQSGLFADGTGQRLHSLHRLV